MALSEHERRELEEIERSLYDEDPDLTATVKSIDIRALATKRLHIGIATTVLGLAILVASVALPNVPLGVFGFLVMLAGGFLMTHAIGARKRTRPRK